MVAKENPCKLPADAYKGGSSQVTRDANFLGVFPEAALCVTRSAVFLWPHATAYAQRAKRRTRKTRQRYGREQRAVSNKCRARGTHLKQCA